MLHVKQARVMSDDQAERRRVYSRIAPTILEFRVACSSGTFHVEDLRRYVLQRVPAIAPDSPGRILRELRLNGLVDYVVINRRASLYQFRPSPRELAELPLFRGQS